MDQAERSSHHTSTLCHMLQSTALWTEWPALNDILDFPGGRQRICLLCRSHRRQRFNPWIGKIPWRKAWQPTPVFLPGESHGQKWWQATVHRVAKSRTWLKWLSMHTNAMLNFYKPYSSILRGSTTIQLRIKSYLSSHSDDIAFLFKCLWRYGNKPWESSSVLPFP